MSGELFFFFFPFQAQTLNLNVFQDYAIETPLKKSSEGDMFYEVKIDFNPKYAIAAINFVLKVLISNSWQMLDVIII